MTEKLEEAERAGKRQTSRFNRNERVADPKKPGRKTGSKPSRRDKPAKADRTISVPLESHACPDCGCGFDVITHPQFQTDIPPVEPTITQFNVEVGTCPCCGKRVQARHPDQTSDALGAANHSLGPNLHGMAASLKHTSGMSFAKVSAFFHEWFHIKTAPSTFVRSLYRIAKKAMPTIFALREQLRRSLRIHADETGWRVGTASCWLWVFCNDEITLFDVAGRDHGVAKAMLGDFDGVLCTDGYQAYNSLELLKQRCNGHVQKRIKDLQSRLTDSASQHSLNMMSALFKTAQSLLARRENMPDDIYRDELFRLEKSFDDWLWLSHESKQPELLRLRKHLLKHRPEWFQYLYQPGLSPTNNLAERQIRPGVITRKLGGCNKSWRGAMTTRILASLAATCRQQGRQFGGMIRHLLHAREPTAITIASLPQI
ncbi:MAG: IS66 family transposase [Planctomycetota bacterium]|nr:IS66 family transposase [Planctomycetota bacterium]